MNRGIQNLGKRTRKGACLKHWKTSSLLLSPVRHTQLLPCLIFSVKTSNRYHLSALHILPFGVLTFICLRKQQGGHNDKVKL